MTRRYRDDDIYDDDPVLRRKRREARRDRKNRTLYILLSAGAVVMLFCGGLAWFVASAVKEVARAARSVNPPVRTADAGPPVARMKAENLYKAYDRNEENADDKYLDESVQVDGTVATIEQLPGIGWRVTLTTGPNHARVHAMFDPDKGPQVSRLSAGMACSIIGYCDGRMPDMTGFGVGLWVVGLSACRIAE